MFFMFCGVCLDIDECTSSTHDCVADATCVNNAGGHACHCPIGYNGDGLNSGDGCTGIDVVLNML